MEITDLLVRHKTIKSFENEYSIMVNPQNYRDQLACINVCSPTLNDMQVAYGSKMKLWLQSQIDILQTVVGVRDKLLAHQTVLLIETFLANGNVKVSMLLNFFCRLIAGHYGRFYGAVDIIQIGEAWQKHLETCRKLYDEQVRSERIKAIEQEKADERNRLEEEMKNAITWDEFVKTQVGRVDNPLTHFNQKKS